MNKIVLEHFNPETDSFLVKKDDFIDAKNLPYKEKKGFIKSLFLQEGTINPQVIINISFLLKKNKTLTKDLFARDDVFFNSYMELLDMKQDLRKELNTLRRDIVAIYYAMTKSISILNQEESTNVCNLKYILMHLLTLEDISVISQLVHDDIPSDDIVLIGNGASMMDQILKNSGYVKGGE